MSIYFILILVLFLIYIASGKFVIKTRRTITINNESDMIEYRNRNMFFCSTLLVTLLMGLRNYTVGIDLIQYKYRYENYELMLNSPAYSSEQGFNIFNYLCNKAGVNWQTYLFIVSLMTTLAIFWMFYKHSQDVMLSVFLYITMGMFTFAMSGIRQSLAVAIGIVAFELILKKKIIIPLLLIAVAFSIHNSAIILLTFFILPRIKITRVSAIMMLLIAGLAIIYRNYIGVVIKILSPERYSDFSLTENYQINPLLIIISIAIPLFCYFFNSNIGRGNEKSIDSILFMMSCLNVFFTILSISNGQIGRIANYYINANAILVANTIKKMKAKDRIIVLPVLIIVCLVFFYLGTDGGTLKIDEYKFFWN